MSYCDCDCRFFAPLHTCLCECHKDKTVDPFLSLSHEDRVLLANAAREWSSRLDDFREEYACGEERETLRKYANRLIELSKMLEPKS